MNNQQASKSRAEIEQRGMPVLLATLTPDNQFRVWCPACATYHYHGAAEGHSAAHCVSGPFKEQGYFLLAPSVSLDETQRRARTQRRKAASRLTAIAGKLKAKGPRKLASVDTGGRKAGRYRSYPTPKTVIVSADRRPWVRQLGLSDAFGDLCMYVLKEFFAGSADRISTRAELRTKRVEAACEAYWRKKYPSAFGLYFGMKGHELTGSLLADRIYNQWYQRQKDGWKKTGTRSKEHPEIKWQ